MASKYNEITEYLVNKIENKEYKKGEVLPTERELTSLFHVSRMTVRRALDELIQEGYAFRKSGSGVYVSYDKNARSAKKISVRNDEDLTDEYGEITIKVIELKKIKANHLCQKYLSLSKDEDVYCLKRVQSGEETPLLYEEIYLPDKYFLPFSLSEGQQSLTTLTSQYMKLNVETTIYQEIEAKLASKKISELLHVTMSSPILQITNVVTHNNQPLYFGIDSFDGYSFKFKTND